MQIKPLEITWGKQSDFLLQSKFCIYIYLFATTYAIIRDTHSS